MDDVYQRLHRAIGLGDLIVFARAVDTAMEALGASISSDDLRDTLADAIEAPLDVALRAGAGRPPVHVADLYSRVEEGSGLRPGVAVEIVQVFFAKLARTLGTELRNALREDLGRDWRPLFANPPPPAPPAEHPRHPGMPRGRGGSFAEGRPGSMRPLYAGRPASAQHESIAASDDPRGASKVSSSRGPTLEREHRTLADGRPGAGARSLSDYES